MHHINAYFSLYDLILLTYYLFIFILYIYYEITLDKKQNQDSLLNCFKHFIFVCLNACLCSPWVWCLQRTEVSVEFSGTGVTHGCERPCGCWELNPGRAVSQLGLLLL